MRGLISSVCFNNFIERKLIERFHSSNLVVNHPVGCKPRSGVWPVVDSQCVPEDPEMSRQSSKWFMARPPTVQSVDTVQQPVDILRSVSAPLFQRYLDLSGSDIWSIIQVRQFLIFPDISLTFRKYQSGLHRASALMRSLYLLERERRILFVLISYLVILGFR